ncbi:sensor domain-containing diguanylate cyclase [Gammaproteobacteria bacterium]|nr:sensor domain-containing diguanylate cyclase [Gammaproteobacteria bacterium]
MANPQNLIPFESYLQNRLESVLNAMPVAISWANLNDQKITYLNAKFNEFFGYQLGDHATVDDWIDQAYVNPKHIKRARAMWAKHFKTSSVVTIEIPQVEVDVLCKDGSIKTTLLGGMIMPKEGWALATFTDITERKENELKIEKLALEDPLTGLGNRRFFQNMLDQSLTRAKRKNKYCGLLLIDLDEFKSLNDTLGHDCGDRALQIIAKRLNSGVREGDLVCRLGGDEFAIILDCMDSENIAEEIAERILKEVAKPASLNDSPASLALSIGIGIFPADANDARTLYKIVDKSLYSAKNSGGSSWQR